MSFDPFGDASTRGYLRNIHVLPAGSKLKELEHDDFSTFLPETLAWLRGRNTLGYRDLLAIHRMLFGRLYPWAGQDRYMLFPNTTVSKGRTQFALSNNIEKAFEIGLKPGNTPGQTLGHWAYAHPFLEGNGRALFTFFDDYLARKGCLLDWPAIDKTEFLQALDAQITDPNSNSLDNILTPHMTRNWWRERPSRLPDTPWRQGPKQ